MCVLCEFVTFWSNSKTPHSSSRFFFFGKKEKKIANPKIIKVKQVSTIIVETGKSTVISLREIIKKKKKKIPISKSKIKLIDKMTIRSFRFFEGFMFIIFN